MRLMAEESRLESRSTPVTFILIAADDDRPSRFGKRPASSARGPEPAPIASRSEHPGTGSPYIWLLISIPAPVVTLALAIASDDTTPDDAPAHGAVSSHESG
ncbi:MAG: hypothetical protein H0U97_06395 [Gammaproteobacteria bacterium]|nr:hypothetical protein [Gammaproteobacteria bacterium]